MENIATIKNTMGAYTTKAKTDKLKTEKGKVGEVRMTIQRMIELLEIEHECMLRGAHDDCDRDCADCELVQDDDELHEMYTDVISLLKEQEPIKPRVSTVEQRCGNCNKVIEMDGWITCPWCGKPILWEAVGRTVK